MKFELSFIKILRDISKSLRENAKQTKRIADLIQDKKDCKGFGH